MASRHSDYIPMQSEIAWENQLYYNENMRQEWLEVWERMDVLNDGKISLSQMKSFILKTDYADALHPEAVTSLLLKADLNEDGFISKEEYLVMVNQAQRSPKVNQLLRQLAFLTIPKSGRNAKVRKYIDEYSCFPPPLFMLTITIAEISVFIYYGITMNQPITAKGPTPFESPLIYNPMRRYEAWRFLTYMFIHSGWLHLLSNTIMQLILGIILELVHKWQRVSLVYLLGVIGGCLAASVATPNYFLAGASGGVYALEYAYIGNLILNWSEMSFPIVQASALGVISITDVSFAIWDIYSNKDSHLQVSYMAHLGGAVVGMLVGVNVLRNLEKEPWEKYCWWISFLLLICLFGTAIIIHLAAPGYFPPADHSPL